MRKQSKRAVRWGGARAIGAAALAATMLAAAAQPAMAGRPLVADFDPNPASATAACSLGSACTSALTLGPKAFADGFGTGNVYVYSEGVVSFGAPLPSTASLAGGTASFGDGTWFATDLGAPLQVTLSESELGNQWFSWSDGGQIMFQIDIRDDTSCGPGCFGTPFWNPGDTNLSDFDVTFNGPGRPGPDYELEAFNLNPETAQFPPCPGAGGLSCPGHLNNDLRGSSGTPEPASWALMIIGFATVGALLRSQRRLEA